MRTIMIFNPTSGDSALANPEEHNGTTTQHEAHLLTALKKQGIEPEVWYTTPEDAGTGLAKKAISEGADMVIAAGGDGTIHAVACGLIGSHSTLGILAQGTMNNIARSLSIPEDVEEACKIIADGDTTSVDVGYINDNIFLEVAGIGLEAALFPAAEEIKSKGWVSTVKGVAEGLSTLFAFKPTGFRVSFDGHRTRRYRALEITICNTPYYGVHLQVAPGTLMNDGLLDVVVYKNFSKLEYLRHGMSIIRGKRIFAPKITRRKIKTLEVSSEQPIPLHADGVPVGYTPARIKIVPSAIQVRVPEKVTSGPNVMQFEQKYTRVHRRADDPVEVEQQKAIQEKEKGTQHAR